MTDAGWDKEISGAATPAARADTRTFASRTHSIPTSFGGLASAAGAASIEEAMELSTSIALATESESAAFTGTVAAARASLEISGSPFASPAEMLVAVAERAATAGALTTRAT